ncbi:MAG: hypothetical protein US89_C0001G0006 [Candidatus Peregrinibacteria bacterium GW2011_GWF2_38_29]|nr:MAG: hypothetical protein US89_C0001G0006 [Candidatus Peregrinibacteria bacterium GW2011_GWF2_38_29]HBB03041.1 hypothetical protein [Candidatus Peregrinibacteria bacterium]
MSEIIDDYLSVYENDPLEIAKELIDEAHKIKPGKSTLSFSGVPAPTRPFVFENDVRELRALQKRADEIVDPLVRHSVNVELNDIYNMLCMREFGEICHILQHAIQNGNNVQEICPLIARAGRTISMITNPGIKAASEKELLRLELLSSEMRKS